MYLEKIKKGQEERDGYVKAIQMLIPPHPSDYDAIYEHKKEVQRLSDLHHATCFGIEHQVHVLLQALYSACGEDWNVTADVVEEAYRGNSEPAWLAARLAQIEEAKEAAAKKRSRKEIPGQIDLRDELANQQMNEEGRDEATV